MTADPKAPPDSGHDDTVVGSALAAARPGAGADPRAGDETIATEMVPGRTGERSRTDAALALAPIDPQRYVIGAELARGGMGRILVARDRRLGRPVAIKELLATSAELRARFAREARITAKLQHPAIVNLLEAGTWPGGEPLYVMKLVAGESLDKVIGRCATLDARLGLLPHVIATADALAYAHSVRVIHRDLKPANVLVGAFGETVVIDWGLAKDLADASGEPDVSIGPYRGGAAGETELGSVMGTPAYMPPEQALGDPVDERADVYALGALLYHVLAGAPPYTGATVEAILAAVVAGPPAPVVARVPGVPRDLAAIVDKAMAHAAADRYPTAKELADDLKKFQTGQLVGAHHYTSWQLLRRWARRQRTPLAVAVVAAVLLGGLGVASVRRIVREQARTEQGRQDAEDLMIFMLGDLGNKLEPLGRLDLLDEVAKKAVAYYDQRGAVGGDGARRTRGLARQRLGDVLAKQGHADQALVQFRAAMAIARTLAGSDRTNVEWQRDLAGNHAKIGDMLRAQGDAAGALGEYRAAMAIVEALAAADPTNAERQRDVAVNHANIGRAVLLAQGDAAAALARYRSALAISERLAAADPTNAERQRDLAVGHHEIGTVLVAQGDAVGALAAYRSAAEIFLSLAAADPTNAALQRDLSVAHNKVGDILLAQGDAAAALAEYRAAMAIRKTLATNDPTSAERQRDVATSHNMLGDALLAQGNAAAALEEYRAWMAIAERLAANDPTNAARQRDLAVSHGSVGAVLHARGDAAGALAEYRAWRGIAQTLAARDPTNATARRDLSVSQNALGDLLLQRGDAAGALVEYQAAISIRVTLAASDPTNAGAQRDLSVSHTNIGDALLAQGNVTGALAEYRASLAITRTVAANDPTNAVAQRDLSVDHNKIGKVLLEQGDAPGALAEYRAAMAVRERLAANDPSNPNARRDLSVSHDNVGDALLAQGDAAGALAQYRASIAIASTLAANDPTNTRWQRDLVESHESIGDALLAQRDKAGALAEYTAALALAHRLVAQDASDATLRTQVTALARKSATCRGARDRGTSP